jgi:glycerate-2-kinase
VINLLTEADEHTLVVCLISGGGSALLVSPYEGISLADKQLMTDLLLKAGASISELSAVRKHLAAVKGGRLAEIAYPAGVMSFIISDVIGDSLDVIASGPTSPDGTTYTDALKVIEKYRLKDKSPGSVTDLLKKGADGIVPETPKENSRIFKKVSNLIIANNGKALQAARDKAEALGFEAHVSSAELAGEAREAGKRLAGKVFEIKNARRSEKPYCLVSGGETTVTVKGNGLGGRNMEMALSFAIEIGGIGGVTFLSAGTDGTDGPTDAAGAIVDGETVSRATALDMDPLGYLGDNDSYHFFQKLGDLFITGPTGTNVMDIQVIVMQ